MTRDAVETGLHRVVDDIVDAVHEEFDAVRALRQGRPSGPGGVVVNRLVKENRVLDRYVVQPEVDRYRSDARRQVSVMCDAAANDQPIETYRDTLLDADVYYTELDPDVPRDTREAIADAVLARYRTAKETVTPVVEAPEDDFWPAVTSALTYDEALELVRANFSFSEDMREHRDALSFSVRLDPGEILGARGAPLPTIEIDYTDESLRAMGRAETRVRRDLDREIERQYAE